MTRRAWSARGACVGPKSHFGSRKLRMATRTSQPHFVSARNAGLEVMETVFEDPNEVRAVGIA